MKCEFSVGRRRPKKKKKGCPPLCPAGSCAHPDLNVTRGEATVTSRTQKQRKEGQLPGTGEWGTQVKETALYRRLL